MPNFIIYENCHKSVIYLNSYGFSKKCLSELTLLKSVKFSDSSFRLIAKPVWFH